MSTTPPTIRLLLTISDVGERGGDITLLVTPADHPQKMLTGTVDEAVDQLGPHLKDLIRLGLWGADQPK